MPKPKIRFFSKILLSIESKAFDQSRKAAATNFREFKPALTDLVKKTRASIVDIFGQKPNCVLNSSRVLCIKLIVCSFKSVSKTFPNAGVSEIELCLPS